MTILAGTETVLVVDDETFMLSLAELMLVCHGYTVLKATSGQEVLHMLELWPDLKIDVAVIDVVMPMMDGFELAERMRKIRPRLPIVYMSAYPEKAELRQIGRASCRERLHRTVGQGMLQKEIANG